MMICEDCKESTSGRCNKHLGIPMKNKSVTNKTGDWERECSSCHNIKSKADFYINRARKDGLCLICKECEKKRPDRTFYRKNYNRTHISESRDVHKVMYLKYKDKPEYKKRVKEAVLRYQAKNKNKILAHQAVMRALERNILKKLPCLICGSENTMAHHPNYTKQLEVIWVCRQHHEEYHKMQKECDKISNITDLLQNQKQKYIEMGEGMKHSPRFGAVTTGYSTLNEDGSITRDSEIYDEAIDDFLEKIRDEK